MGFPKRHDKPAMRVKWLLEAGSIMEIGSILNVSSTLDS